MLNKALKSMSLAELKAILRAVARSEALFTDLRKNQNQRYLNISTTIRSYNHNIII